MKIIITESQFKTLLESSDKSNVIEQILEMEGIKYDGCEYDGRTHEYDGRIHDSVVFYFEFPNDYKHRSIRFLTKNNKVVRVSSSSDFRTIADGFRYIPTDVLMSYFIEKGKRHLENILSDRYPNDSLKESVIKEENLKSELKRMVKSDGWESVSPLVGGEESLSQLAYDNDPMEFIDSLGLKKEDGKHSIYFSNDEGTVFLSVSTTSRIVDLFYIISEFLYKGFNLNREDAKNVIKQWLSDRHDIKVKIRNIYL